jgi:hypothetical protein
MPPGGCSTTPTNAVFQDAVNITLLLSKDRRERKEGKTMGFNQNDDEDDLFERVSAMADRMGIEGEKRATYIDDHMLQGGYERVQSRESYAKVRQSDDNGRSDGNRWGFGGRNNSGRSRRDDDDSF